MNTKSALYLINKTKQNYNTIADLFSTTRTYLPHDLKVLSRYIQAGQKILDVGCGNGRFSEVVNTKNAQYFGVDISQKLINIAKSRYPDQNFQIIDSPSPFPYEDNYFDAVFCLATLHHIPSIKFRRQFLSEIRRVLKPSGQMYLTVWYLRAKFSIRLQLLKMLFLKTFHLTKFDYGDIFYPFKDQSGKILVNRYFHCFTKNELINLMSTSYFSLDQILVQSRAKEYNIFICATKKNT